MKENPNPHDSLITRLFSSKKNVRDFMSQYLPEAVRSEINFDIIDVDMSQHVSDELKKYTSDIVIRTETRKNKNTRTLRLNTKQCHTELVEVFFAEIYASTGSA